MIKKIFCIITLLLWIPNIYAHNKIKVVSSFSILADVIKNIGKDRVKVYSIVGANEDAHVYEPTPADNKLISDSDIVFINGLGFEVWFENLVKSSNYIGKVINVSGGIQPIMMYEPLLYKVPVPDPHVWNDVNNVVIWVNNISKALQAIDPLHRKYYIKNETLYLQQLQKLHSNIKLAIANVKKTMLIVTSHDAFNYYEKAYDVKFLTPQGISTDTEPSAFDVANIIKQIRQHKIRKIFIENIASNHLIRQIQDETKVKIGGTLYSDALSHKNEVAPTYIDLMWHNTNNMVSSYK